MLEINLMGENRIDINFAGKIDSETMATMLDRLLELGEQFERGNMLYRIGDFQMPTLGALGVEFARLPKLLKFLGKIDKIAVLCDKEWLQKIAEVEGKLIPGLDMKSFDLDDEDDALEWLQDD